MIDVTSSAPDGYADFAGFYNAFTHHYEHERWLGRLEELARAHGLRGRRVLDVGCGTGKSLRPLIAMGYDGEGCDVSTAMLREAGRLLPGVAFFRADMRDLPPRRPYSWVTCVDDAVNHLLGDNDLGRALASMANALERGGVLTFDVNTLMTHRAAFDSTFVVRQGRTLFSWRGRGRANGAGEPGAVEITVFEQHATGWWRSTSHHRERWWSDVEVEAAARAAGLEIVGRYGQREGAIIDCHLDERCHTKIVYVLTRV